VNSSRKRFLAPLAAVAVAAAGGALALGGTAQAAGGFTDTSLQASNFVWQHHITGVAQAAGGGVVGVTGLRGDQTGFGGSPNAAVTYAVSAGADVDGVTLSATNTSVTIPSIGVIVADGSLNPGAGTNVDALVTLTATDSDGDDAIVTVPVTVTRVGAGAVVSIDTPLVASELTTDEVNTISNVNNNTDGSITFAAKDTDDLAIAIGESNLPAGLTSANPLRPATAEPGDYNDLQVTATDTKGATATGSFLLKVNGGATPVAPVPVLSHGQATYVSATRENVAFDTSITTWVHFQIAGPGAIDGHEGWVHAVAGQLNKAVYSGLEANHTYAVFFTPVDGQGSTVQIVGTHTGHVTFISNRP
jgi:hypothetical protein